MALRDNRPARLLLAAGGPLFAALIGGRSARTAPETYARLRKPGWAPPAGAFGPVWTVLYVLIGVAGWRLTRGRPNRAVLALHLVQLSLNAAWPGTFFRAGDKRAALAVVGALDAALAAEIALLARTDRPAAALLSPYLAWSLFATALNASVSEPDGPGYLR